MVSFRLLHHAYLSCAADGNDGNGPPGPVTFDNVTTHHMSLYDVGMTALYLSDTQVRVFGDEVETLL
jgi:hypothetical protein